MTLETPNITSPLSSSFFPFLFFFAYFRADNCRKSCDLEYFRFVTQADYWILFMYNLDYTFAQKKSLYKIYLFVISEHGLSRYAFQINFKNCLVAVYTRYIRKRAHTDALPSFVCVFSGWKGETGVVHLKSWRWSEGAGIYGGSVSINVRYRATLVGPTRKKFARSPSSPRLPATYLARFPYRGDILFLFYSLGLKRNKKLA